MNTYFKFKLAIEYIIPVSIFTLFVRDLCRKWNDDPLRRPDLLCQHQYKLLAAAFLYIWASALTDWR